MSDPSARDVYVRNLLGQYRNLPDTLGHIRRTDRRLAEQLYGRGVPLSLVETAFALATCRRLLRSADAAPLERVRTLHYYLGVVQELQEQPFDPDYLGYLKAKLAALAAAQRQSPHPQR